MTARSTPRRQARPEPVAVGIESKEIGQRADGTPISRRAWSIVTDWNARDQVRGDSLPGARRRWEAARLAHRQAVQRTEEALLVQRGRNQDRIADLKARGLRLPGQPLT